MQTRKISNQVEYGQLFLYQGVGLHSSSFRLLDFEHRASEQIPLLLKLGQEPQALAKAVESGDPNLIYYVLVVMKETYSADKFYMTIRHYPSVNALYAKLCRTIQMGSLEQIYEQEDNFNAQAILSVKDSYRAQVSKYLLIL